MGVPPFGGEGVEVRDFGCIDGALGGMGCSGGRIVSSGGSDGGVVGEC